MLLQAVQKIAIVVLSTSQTLREFIDYLLVIAALLLDSLLGPRGGGLAETLDRVPEFLVSLPLLLTAAQKACREDDRRYGPEPRIERVGKKPAAETPQRE